MTRPMIMAMVVVLPAPLPPRSPVMEPRSSANEMPSTAVVVLYSFTSWSTAMTCSTVLDMSDVALRGPDMWRGAAHEARGIGHQARCGDRARWRPLSRPGYIVAMTDQPAEEAHRTGRSVRLDTLVRLRWLAVIGQTTAVLVVYFGLDYELPIWACLAVIALAAWLNVALRIRFPMTQRLEP